MSLKVKLTSTIAAFLLILGLTIMGVFAAPTATIQLGGSLNFKATDVHAKVTGVIAGTKVDPQPSLTDLVFEAGETTDVSSWANVPLEFTDAGSEITITVTIENLATDRPLYATVEDAVGSVDNVTKSMKKGADAYTGDVIELPASTGTGTSTAVITLSMKVTDPNASIADDATYGYSIELNNEEPKEEIYSESYWNELGVLFSDVATSSSTGMFEAKSTLPQVKVYADFSNLEKLPETLNIPSHVLRVDKSTGQETKYVVTQVGTFCDDMEYSRITTKHVVFPDAVTSIGSYAFWWCTSLESVIFGKGLTSIGSSAFSYCSGLTGELVIPDSVTSISGYAFSACAGFTGKLVIPEGVTSIGNFAFEGCSGLTSVTIGSGVISIGASAFSSCGGLETIVVEEGNSVYDSRENCNAIIETVTNTLIRGCENTTIPNSVTSIGDGAFAGCHGLISITIPSNVTNIGSIITDCFNLVEIFNQSSVEITPTSCGLTTFQNPDIRIYTNGESNITEDENGYVFYEYEGEYKLIAYHGEATELILPGDFNGNSYSIRKYAFYSNKNITSVVIPQGVTNIGRWVFKACDALTTITIEATTPPTLGGSDAIPSNVTEIRVPSASLSAYQSATNWSSFASKMVGF